jgi:hypothetical protein
MAGLETQQPFPSLCGGYIKHFRMSLWFNHLQITFSPYKARYGDRPRRYKKRSMAYLPRTRWESSPLLWASESSAENFSSRRPWQHVIWLRHDSVLRIQKLPQATWQVLNESLPCHNLAPASEFCSSYASQNLIPVIDQIRPPCVKQQAE